MDDSALKVKLFELGFKNKEISLICKKAEKKKSSLMKTISSMRVKFFIGLLFRMVIIIYSLVCFFREDKDLIFIIIDLIASLLAVEFFMPFALGAKIASKFKMIRV